MGMTGYAVECELCGEMVDPKTHEHNEDEEGEQN